MALAHKHVADKMYPITDTHQDEEQAQIKNLSQMWNKLELRYETYLVILTYLKTRE